MQSPLFKIGKVQKEFPVPEDLELVLYRNTPQSLLRDLHRPITKFTVSQFDFEQHETIQVDAGTATAAANRAVFFASYRVPIVELLHVTKDMLAAYAQVRAVIKLPWTDAPKLGKELHLPASAL